ncbi:MAG: prolipoprotein diacylglyceryl transferase [Clostridia bacterium]|nr:prolipoprotein diacylglyceryl transferase [Clostridia bacterium]
MIYDVTIFGLHLSINPVAFTLPFGGGWRVYWYGICIAVGFVLALVYAFKYANRCNVQTDPMLDVVLVTTPLAILCARLYYIIFYGEPIRSIGDFFGFDGGGFAGIAIYGGVIGAMIFGSIMCKIKKIRILDMFDLAAIGFLIGQGCGRWGNFFNQEAFGGPTGSDWFGMTSQRVAAELGEGVLAHPCFLYESILCFIGVGIMHRVLKHRKYSGQIALIYCVWYGAARAVIEGLRTDSLYIGAFRVSQLLSIAAVIFGAVMLAVNHRKYNARSAEADYVPVFAATEAEAVVDEVVTPEEETELEPESTVDEVLSSEEFEEQAEDTQPVPEPEIDEVLEEAIVPEETTEPEHRVDEILQEATEDETDDTLEAAEDGLSEPIPVDEIVDDTAEQETVADVE